MKSSLLLALLSALIAAAGQTLLKQVMTNIGAVEQISAASLLPLVVRLLREPLFYVAGVVYVLGFGSWLIVLSRLDLSLAYPILAITYVLVPLAGVLFFDESVPPLRWAGIFVIIAGIVLVSLSQRNS
ncbi:MAG TPA: EamA family transporter [Aggregatilineales bacterium]|nr:EamA family transporter [Aggregatilineales bacterium]